MISSPQAQNTEETQRINSVRQFGAMESLSQMPQLQLSKTKANELEKRRLSRNTRKIAKSGNGTGGGDTIACECGHQDEEDGMVSQYLGQI